MGQLDHRKSGVPRLRCGGGAGALMSWHDEGQLYSGRIRSHELHALLPWNWRPSVEVPAAQ